MSRVPHHQPSPKYQASDADRRYGPGVEKCAVPGCDGSMYPTTDGNGRLVMWCEACALRLEQMRMLRSTKVREVVREVPRELTDEELAQEIARRFSAASTIAQELATTAHTVHKAAADGKVLGVRLDNGFLLVSRSSVAQWRRRPYNRTRKGNSWLIDYLPTSEGAALTIRDLAEKSGKMTVLVQTALQVLQRGPGAAHLHRIGERGRGGYRGGCGYRYWWSGPTRSVAEAA